MRRDEAEDFAVGVVVRVVITEVVVVRSHRRRVVNITGQECAFAVGVHVPDRVVLMTALSAEVDGVEAFLGIVRQKLLSINSNNTAPGRIECRVRVACTRKELMQFESKETLRVAVLGPRAIDLRDTRDE